MGEQAAIALGSNLSSRLGDRAAALSFAVESLQRTRGVRVLRVSRWIETAPVGPAGQGAYLNGAAVLVTALSARALLGRMQEIERAAGRDRAVERRWGARPLDLDLLYYGDRIVRERDLVTPHPRLAERSFVLVPLAEAAPRWRHPETGELASEMLARLRRLKEKRPARRGRWFV